MISKTLLLCLFALSSVNALYKSGCSVRIRGSMSVPTPLILQSGEAAFVVPNRYADVEVDSGKSIDLFCSDQFKQFSGKLVSAKCVSGVKFEINGKTYDFEDITCKSWPESTAQYTGQTCANNQGKLISVGFEVSKSRFVPQYQVCFNAQSGSTYWSKYSLGAYSKYYQTKVDRVDFKEGNFFGKLNVNNLYTQKKQKKTITNELGTSSTKYFDAKDNVFLARGHLAAKADFVYGAQEQASFWFVNVAPQWQCINAGNWGEIEIIVRDLANSKRSSFIVFSGTNGVSTLPNSNGKQTPLYLSQGSNSNNGEIPVPQVYYRAIYEPTTQKGVVLIVVNDPHKSLTELQQQGYILCNDISDELSYLQELRTRRNIEAGYTYACTVEDFAQAVPEFPAKSAPGGVLY